MFWFYKCNSIKRTYQVASGDWSDFFHERRIQQWGSTEWTPDVKRANRGDIVIAYQTNRNELVGLAEVVRLKPRGQFLDLMLKPKQVVGVKVKPLKPSNKRIGAIPALQPGPIRTLYDISDRDAKLLLQAAGVDSLVEATSSHSDDHFAQDSIDLQAIENTLTEARRYIRKRDRRLRQAALADAHGICNGCQRNFEVFLDGLGRHVLQVHHMRQMLASDSPRITTLDDLIVLCANCHAIIHADPLHAMPVAVLRQQLALA